MTLVKIDIKNVASETHPDDRVVFYSPTLREAPGGGITSTAETVVPLVDGVGEKELVPGPVTVTFQCRGISDTRPKSGTVPDAGPVGIEDVIAGAFEYTPPVVNRGLDLIEGARDEALGQVAGAVDAEISTHLVSKADKTQLWHKGALGERSLNILSPSLGPGLWDQRSPELATLERGYPLEGVRGYLVMHTPVNSLAWALQTFTTVDTPRPRSFTRKWLSGNSWAAWEELSTIRDAEIVARTEVANIVGTAPQAFDTLGEIADELAENESERAALANAISMKADRSAVEEALAGKASAASVSDLSDTVKGKADADEVSEALEAKVDKSAISEILQGESALDILAAKIGFGGAGQHTVGVVADSTMNDSNDPIRLLDRKVAALLGATTHHEYHAWRTATSDWSQTINNDSPVTPPSDGTIIDDDFTRVADDIVGTAPNVGPIWQGTAGTWKADGARAIPIGSGHLWADTGTRDITVDLTLDVITAGTGAQQNHRYFLGSSSSNREAGVWLAIGVTAAGVLTWGLWTTFGSTSTQIGGNKLGSSLGVTTNSATPQTVSFRVKIDIQNISITATGPTASDTLSSTITEAQYAGLSTGVTLRSFANTANIRVDRVVASVPPTPTSGDLLEVWNGAIAGGRWVTFNAAKRAEMFSGKHIDILLLSMGHNNGTQSGAEFVAETEQWLAAWMQEHPETKKIIWVSQNPKFEPAANVVPHRERQAAIRAAAKKNGWDYIPGYEAFSTQPDGGKSLVGSDGIHPTTPPVGAMVGDYGAVFMADLILDQILARI